MKVLVALIFLCLSINNFSKTIVISDIDDTIKTSNSMGVFGQLYYFLRMGSYPSMSKIYNDFAEEYKGEIEFIYVSAAPDAIYDQDAWLSSKNFPFGKTLLRATLLEETYQYKMRTIRALIKERDCDAHFYFFGDNSSKDRRVYQDIVEEFKIEHFSIYIRDVSTIDTFQRKTFSKSFFTELDLIEDLSFLSEETISFIKKRAQENKLLPDYTTHTLKRLLRKNNECERRCLLADQLIEDYFAKF